MTEAAIRERLAAPGIDMDRADRDLTENAKAIDAVLARTTARPMAFGFNGTPSFIVGKFRVPGILTMAQFEMAIADARKAKKAKLAISKVRKNAVVNDDDVILVCAAID